MNIEGAKRRQQLVEILDKEVGPMSGTRLAKALGVSRQIIVQDIALLRAENRNIIATNKGYMVHKVEAGFANKETIAVCHGNDQIQDELYTIVDMGGHVLDVVVEHGVYGQIAVDLIIKSRRDVDEFVAECNRNHSKPLTELTNGVHYHTVETENEETMKDILNELNEKGYLISKPK